MWKTLKFSSAFPWILLHNKDLSAIGRCSSTNSLPLVNIPDKTKLLVIGVQQTTRSLPSFPPVKLLGKEIKPAILAVRCPRIKQGNTETPLDGEKEFSLVEGSSTDPSFPGRAYDRGWYISLKKKEKKKVANLLHEKQEVGLSRRVIRLACLPFCDGRITLLAGPTFLSVNTLARPAGSTQGQNATIRVCFLFSPINCLLNWIKLVRLGGWP